MAVSYELRNYWCASRMVSALTPRVAARYLTPRILWAVTERERLLLEQLKARVLRAERETYEPNILPLPAARAAD